MADNDQPTHPKLDTSWRPEWVIHRRRPSSATAHKLVARLSSSKGSARQPALTHCLCSPALTCHSWSPLIMGTHRSESSDSYIDVYNVPRWRPCRWVLWRTGIARVEWGRIFDRSRSE